MLDEINLQRVPFCPLVPPQSSSSLDLLPANEFASKKESHDTGDVPASVSRTPSGQFVIAQGDQRVVLSRAALPRVIATLYRLARRG